MRLWFYDHLATWAVNAGNAVAAPFARLERFAYKRWARLRYTRDDPNWPGYDC